MGEVSGSKPDAERKNRKKKNFVKKREKNGARGKEYRQKDSAVQRAAARNRFLFYSYSQ